MSSDRHGDGANRNLSTARSQVFGDVEPGTQCRVCGRNVEDGRAKTCSDYCENILVAVMNLLNWSGVRRRIIDRDDETCQECGFDMARERRARDHIKERIDETAGEEPEGPSMLLLGRGEVEDDEIAAHREAHREYRERRDDATERYGDPYERARSLEVDHIERIADGGHPFDPGNLQTLCDACHAEKTAAENSGPSTPRRPEIEQTLADFAGGASN